MARDEHDLKSEFSLGGEWWLPANTDHRVYGELNFRPGEGLFLDLKGSFDQQIFGIGQRNFAVVHGVTEAGRPVTLLDCMESNSTFNLLGMPRSRFLVKFGLIGKLFTDEASIRFTSLTVRYSNLEEWVGEIVIQRMPEDGEDWIYKYRKLPSHVFRVQPINSELELTSEANGNVEIYRSLNLKHNAVIKIRPDEQQDLNWFIKQSYTIGSLLDVLIDESIQITKLTAFGDEITVGDFTRREEIDIIFNQVQFGEKDFIHPLKMLFQFPSVSALFANILNNWFANYQAYKPTYDLYFHVFNSGTSYPEPHLLSLTQALESYHRVRGGDKYVTDEEYERFKEALENSIPADTPAPLRAKLRSQIKYGNQFSLRKRLQDIFASLPNSIKTVIIGHYTEPAFISAVVDTRNYYTHYSEELQPMALTDDRLFFMNKRLEALVLSLLLGNCGINFDDIAMAIERSGKLSYLQD